MQGIRRGEIAAPHLHVIRRYVLGVELVQGVVQVAGLAVGFTLGTYAATDVDYVLPALLGHPGCLGCVFPIVEQVDCAAGQGGKVSIGSSQHRLLHNVQGLCVAGYEDPDHKWLRGYWLCGLPRQPLAHEAESMDEHRAAGHDLEDQDEHGVPKNASLECVSDADVVVEDVGQ